MLTETLSGKCPCCGYDKLLQRYGSLGYHQLDGCANCGFGNGTFNLPPKLNSSSKAQLTTSAPIAQNTCYKLAAVN